MHLGLSGPRWRFFKSTVFIAAVGLVTFVLGEFCGGPYLFDVGLAVTILGMTLLGQIWFQLGWVEERA